MMALINKCVRSCCIQISFLHRLNAHILPVLHGVVSDLSFRTFTLGQRDFRLKRDFQTVTPATLFGTSCLSRHMRNSQGRSDTTSRAAADEISNRMHRKIQKENVLTVPNALCLLRMLSTPVLGYLVLSEFYTMSLNLLLFAAFTDVADGLIARHFPSQRSMIGSFLDPAADKLLIATLFVTLTVNGLIPVWLTCLIIGRDAFLFSAGFYIRYVSLPPPKTLSRYFDMTLITAKLSPTNISKVNTLVQLCLVAASLAAPVFNFVDHSYLHALWYFTAATTTLAAASYLYYNQSTYKLLQRKDE